MTASWLDRYGSPAPLHPHRPPTPPIPPAPAAPVRRNPLAPVDLDATRVRAKALAVLIGRHADEYAAIVADLTSGEA